MIIRCHHLREAGMMNECCPHCHLLAGLVGEQLSNNHKVICCCGHAAPLTLEEKETLLARIPQWEVQETSPSLHSEDDQKGISHLSTEWSFSTVSVLPTCLRPAYQAIQRLEGYERYLAAFISGSVAPGDAPELNLLDVHIIVNERPPCRGTANHPSIGGVQLNLTILSWEQFDERTRKEIDQHQRMRPLTIAESMIIFDKTGKLRRMREEAQLLEPRKVSARERHLLQFMLLFCQKKAEYHLEKDPLTASLIMHMDLISLLAAHYKQHQRWWVGPHHLLADLSTWDLELAHLVGKFLAASEVHIKFQLWSALIDSILQPLGGHQPLPAQNCPCSRCQKDVSLLLEE